MEKELQEMLKEVTNALDNMSEDFNFGVYDNLIKKSRDLIEKSN